MGLNSIYKPGFKLAKVGVMLMDLMSGSVEQVELDLEPDDAPDRSKLMTALDSLNPRYGRGTVVVGSSGAGEQPRRWTMKQERPTPRYTTSIQEIPNGTE